MLGCLECSIYHTSKYNAECWKMIDASRRHAYLEVDDQ